MPAPGTDKQARFAVAYAQNGGDAVAAAVDAGYSEHSAKDLGYRALQSPVVQEMIMAELTRQRARAGTIGLKALIDVAQSDKAPAAAKVAAGRALVEYAGLAGAARGDGDSAGHVTVSTGEALDRLAAILAEASNSGQTIQ